VIWMPTVLFVGAHFREHGLSHQIVERIHVSRPTKAVAEHLTSLEVPFLRRIHPASRTEQGSKPLPPSLASLGYKIDRFVDRFHACKKILKQAASRPESGTP